jgi:hypothetical protein
MRQIAPDYPNAAFATNVFTNTVTNSFIVKAMTYSQQEQSVIHFSTAYLNKAYTHTHRISKNDDGMMISARK